MTATPRIGRPRHRDGTIDRRYSIAREFCGHKKPQWVARFCGDWLGCAPRRLAALATARNHQMSRCQALGIEPPLTNQIRNRSPL